MVDALNVSLIWQVVNRLANVFDFELLPSQLEVEAARCAGSATASRASRGPRQAAATGDAWGSYTATVRTASHRITDEDIAQLKHDHTEDEIFEVTVAAAVGAALTHYDTGVKILGD